MEAKEKRTSIAEWNEEALFADGFDEAIIGYARRCGQPTLAVYDVDKCIRILMKGGLDYDDAVEHFEFNVVGAWLGENTPIFMYGFEE